MWSVEQNKTIWRATCFCKFKFTRIYTFNATLSRDALVPYQSVVTLICTYALCTYLWTHCLTSVQCIGFVPATIHIYTYINTYIYIYITEFAHRLCVIQPMYTLNGPLSGPRCIQQGKEQEGVAGILCSRGLYIVWNCECLIICS